MNRCQWNFARHDIRQGCKIPQRSKIPRSKSDRPSLRRIPFKLVCFEKRRKDRSIDRISIKNDDYISFALMRKKTVWKRYPANFPDELTN